MAAYFNLKVINLYDREERPRTFFYYLSCVFVGMCSAAILMNVFWLYQQFR